MEAIIVKVAHGRHKIFVKRQIDIFLGVKMSICLFISMVPGAGLEPAQPCGRGILSPLCLPFHHPGVCCAWQAARAAAIE